jgi:hypothetical protein
LVMDVVLLCLKTRDDGEGRGTMMDDEVMA